MPQANTVNLEAFETGNSNLDLISGRRGGGYNYHPPHPSSSTDRHRERTYSLPTRPSFHGTDPQAQTQTPYHRVDPQRSHVPAEIDASDPVERMRQNLERTTYLLSNLKVSLASTSKPEDIHVLPSSRPGGVHSSSRSSSSSDDRYGSAPPPESVTRHHSEPQKHSSAYYDSRPPPAVASSSRSRQPSHAHSPSHERPPPAHTQPQTQPYHQPQPPPPQPHTQPPTQLKKTKTKTKQPPPPSRPALVAPDMERSESNATAFSIAVSTYAVGQDMQPEDHGSEFHQLINHGRLHNPSRGGMLRRQALVHSTVSAYTPPPPLTSTSTAMRGGRHAGERRERVSEREKEKENFEDHGRMPKEKERDGERTKTSQLTRHRTPYPAPSSALVPYSDPRARPRERGPGYTLIRHRNDYNDDDDDEAPFAKQAPAPSPKPLPAPLPKIVSRPFPPEFLPYPVTPSPDVVRSDATTRRRGGGHGRSVSVSHPLPREPPSGVGVSGRRKIPEVGMRRVRFDF